MTQVESKGWPAPAKLNLFLHVLGRRPDGYHELQTAFQFLDWHDTLDFRVRQDDLVTRSGWDRVPAEKDLAVRAALCLREAVGSGPGVEIRVTKRLPTGGGLGGGSSDAATVLLALNRLWEANLSPGSLADLGLSLGADVPVFVHGHAAMARGIGEILEPADLPEPYYVVLDPGEAVATAAVFQARELTRNSAPTTIPGLLSGRVRNDCETVVRDRYPGVARALDWLAEHGDARLTGTGGCVFAAFSDEQAARRVARQVPSPWRARVARGRNRSPLLDRLSQPL